MDSQFECLKATLQQAFSAPADTYISLTADDIMTRHKRNTATPEWPSKPAAFPDKR